MSQCNDSSVYQLARGGREVHEHRRRLTEQQTLYCIYVQARQRFSVRRPHRRLSFSHITSHKMYQLFTDTQSRVSGWMDGALAEHQHTLINTNHHDTCLFKQALNSILFNNNTHVRASITNIHSDRSELLTAGALVLLLAI